MTTTLLRQIEIEFGGETICLRGDGSVYLPVEKALLVADLHLGKDASFRAAGIPVPTGMNKQTLRSLSRAISETQATQIFLLGDLIHDANSITAEVRADFTDWRNERPEIDVKLVRGNHDRHVFEFPTEWGMVVVDTESFSGLELRHEISQQSLSGNTRYQIGGHWHPVVLFGRGADRMRLRCFVVEDRALTLPAFGPFKGGMKQAQSANRLFFPICEGRIWRL